MKLNLKKIKKKIINGPKWLLKMAVWIYGAYCYFKSRFKIKRDLSEYRLLNKRETFIYQKKYKFFINNSGEGEAAGTTDAYYWQDLWAATKIIEVRPDVHYDIGSSIAGFIAHLQTARIRTNLIDIRPLNTTLPYVDFTQADATCLEGIPDRSINSISALCSLEHFGLGRYGDPIDPEACFKAFRAIQRVLKPGGRCYISVPIGKEHLEFNAHRIFNVQTIIEEFSECEVIEIMYNTVGEEIRLARLNNIHMFDAEMDNGGGRFGLFEFVKKQ